MFNPLRSLKYLPWGPLLQIAGLATLVVGLLERLLIVAISQFNLWPLLTSIFLLLDVVKFGLSFGTGVLAVVILQRWFSRLYITANVLWALVGCLMLTLWVKTLLPVEGLTSLDQLTIVESLLGVFWQGRRHWRR
ncbi:MAG: peptide chain release factor 1 [Cyanobacteria bacterium P01_A01_bin.114]